MPTAKTRQERKNARPNRSLGSEIPAEEFLDDEIPVPKDQPKGILARFSSSVAWFFSGVWWFVTRPFVWVASAIAWVMSGFVYVFRSIGNFFSRLLSSKASTGDDTVVMDGFTANEDDGSAYMLMPEDEDKEVASRASPTSKTDNEADPESLSDSQVSFSPASSPLDQSPLRGSLSSAEEGPMQPVPFVLMDLPKPQPKQTAVLQHIYPTETQFKPPAQPPVQDGKQNAQEQPLVPTAPALPITVNPYAQVMSNPTVLEEIKRVEPHHGRKTVEQEVNERRRQKIDSTRSEYHQCIANIRTHLDSIRETLIKGKSLEESKFVNLVKLFDKAKALSQRYGSLQTEQESGLLNGIMMLSISPLDPLDESILVGLTGEKDALKEFKSIIEKLQSKEGSLSDEKSRSKVFHQKISPTLKELYCERLVWIRDQYGSSINAIETELAKIENALVEGNSEKGQTLNDLEKMMDKAAEYARQFCALDKQVPEAYERLAAIQQALVADPRNTEYFEKLMLRKEALAQTLTNFQAVTEAYKKLFPDKEKAESKDGWLKLSRDYLEKGEAETAKALYELKQTFFEKLTVCREQVRPLSKIRETDLVQQLNVTIKYYKAEIVVAAELSCKQYIDTLKLSIKALEDCLLKADISDLAPEEQLKNIEDHYNRIIGYKEIAGLGEFKKAEFDELAIKKLNLTIFLQSGYSHYQKAKIFKESIDNFEKLQSSESEPSIETFENFRIKQDELEETLSQLTLDQKNIHAPSPFMQKMQKAAEDLLAPNKAQQYFNKLLGHLEKKCKEHLAALTKQIEILESKYFFSQGEEDGLAHQQRLLEFDETLKTLEAYKDKYNQLTSQPYQKYFDSNQTSRSSVLMSFGGRVPFQHARLDMGILPSIKKRREDLASSTQLRDSLRAIELAYSAFKGTVHQKQPQSLKTDDIPVRDLFGESPKGRTTSAIRLERKSSISGVSDTIFLTEMDKACKTFTLNLMQGESELAKLKLAEGKVEGSSIVSEIGAQLGNKRDYVFSKMQKLLISNIHLANAKFDGLEELYVRGEDITLQLKLLQKEMVVLDKYRITLQDFIAKCNPEHLRKDESQSASQLCKQMFERKNALTKCHESVELKGHLSAIQKLKTQMEGVKLDPQKCEDDAMVLSVINSKQMGFQSVKEALAKTLNELNIFDQPVAKKLTHQVEEIQKSCERTLKKICEEITRRLDKGKYGNEKNNVSNELNGVRSHMPVVSQVPSLFDSAFDSAKKQWSAAFSFSLNGQTPATQTKAQKPTESRSDANSLAPKQ